VTGERDKRLGVVLAGGRSRRMGTDKALLRWQGRTWLDRARRLLREAGAERVIVLGRPEAADGLADPVPGGGPAVNLAGLMARLAPGTRLLVVPVDMPALDAAVLADLAGRPAGGTPRGCVLPAVVIVPGAPVRPAGDSLRALWAALALPAIDLPAGAVPGNVNTPADLVALQEGAPPWT
jgi:molybdopterin-guanine dinucleotide biosynthesis protein A